MLVLTMEGLCSVARLTLTLSLCGSVVLLSCHGLVFVVAARVAVD